MFAMEDRLNMNPSGTQGSSVTKSNAKVHNDIMARRLKNRERQRRYRARKRLKADMQKSHVQSQPTMPQVKLPLNGILSNGMTRVHCKRNWKRDARRAHICKGQDDTLNAAVQPTLIGTVESQTPSLPSGIEAEGSLKGECHSDNAHTLGDCETRKPKLGRRDWKADARNKKS